MLALQIDNPEIELLFKVKFNSNKENFIKFIKESLDSLDDSNTFNFKKLDPKQNASIFSVNNQDEECSSNPFKEIMDVASFSTSLRTKSYR